MFATLELPLRDDSRHKRLKVGRACHPCRMKKIKCDGKQPCMQCKARRRKCMYLKNSDETYIKLDPLTDNGVSDSFFQDIAERAQEQQQRQQRLAAAAASSSSSAVAGGSSNSGNGNGTSTTASLVEEKIFMADDKNDHLFSGGSPPPIQQQQQSTSNSNGNTNSLLNNANGGSNGILHHHHHHHHHTNGIERSTTPGASSVSSNGNNGTSGNNNRANTRPDKMIEQLTDGLVRLTLHHDAPHLDDDTVTPWRNYGDFVRWSPEPNLPHYYTAPIDMPSRPIQEHLIHVFFSQCHPILPTLSRSMFFDQLNVKGPLITPLLLNIMYAHAAKHVQDTSIQGHVFYNRARRLVDDFLDVPRVSTVIALLYMASYHNEEQTDTRIRSSRAWMYSGMAVRMCLELGLHTTNYSSQMSQFDIELRKRVLWTCFVMDKLESCLTERPWMLRAKDIALEFPTPLPEDDVQERSVLEGFGQLCRLMILMERVIHFFAYDIKNRTHHTMNPSTNTTTSSANNSSGLLWTMNEENQTLQLLDELAQWRDNLPDTLHWTPHHNNVPQSSIVANLHLVFYDLELSLVMCCRYQDERLHRERRRTLANTITHIVSLTIQHPHLMYTFGLTAFSAIFAALTHAADFEHPMIPIADDAKMQFRKTLEDVRAIVEHVPARDMHNFARLVDLTLQPPPSQQQTVQQQTTATTLPSIQIPSNNNSTSTANSAATSRMSYANAFSAITNLVHDDNKSSNVFATPNQHHHPQQQQQPQVSAAAAAAAAAVVMSEAFTQGSTSTTLAPFTTTAGLVPSPFTTQFDPTCIPSSSTPTAKTQSVSSVTGSNTSVGNGEPPKSIEPADYTFELISVADEWARTLMYQ
ncbi:fungal-specific transcription factor domain-containing protein [Phascolomyces articulosus]|uniref:Fungal-specific transcription factor domain-containing protein n=1 Tax=Phascolomyces articulosus TaxID=60185 RepID=A0AAD5K368_9FUNG|nr:fungal-specific transcription factor domain-containing protein [Phascolomyces articulosus]